MDSRIGIAAALLLLAGCDNHVSVQLATSGALDAQHVRLAVSQAELVDDAGNHVPLDAGDTGVKEMLDFDTGSTIALVSGANLPQGHYVGLGLTFSPGGAQIVTSNGQTFPITVPSGATVADVDFTASRKDNVTIWASLDLRLSLSDQTSGGSGSWQLVPRLNVVDLANSASVGGTIAQTVRDSGNCLQGRTAPPAGAAVYAYPVANAVPYDDASGASPHPTGTVAVTWNGNGTGTYRFPHLRPGDYTLALNCASSQDDPQAAQNQAFAASDTVTLSAGQSATLDFN